MSTAVHQVQQQKCAEEDQEKSKADRKGQKTVLNFSSRRLSDDDFILLGKGLSFCPKTKCHDKIKLAEEHFEYIGRLRLKEFVFESDKNKDTPEKEDNYSDLQFFNKKKKSSVTPPSDREVYLDFYIDPNVWIVIVLISVITMIN